MADRPVLLDLYCGAGGAAMGYFRAGFDVIGVDRVAQPSYPFVFHQEDAIDVLDALAADRWHHPVAMFHAIHASPPCQAFSKITKQYGSADAHSDLVDFTREMLEKIDLPWVIENVEGAPLRLPLMLCGSMFGLGGEIEGQRGYLRRHRLFESSLRLLTPPGPCRHEGNAIGVYGRTGGSSTRNRLTFGTLDVWKEAMGIDWMCRRELVESIPPAFTEYVGWCLLEQARA